MTPFLENSYYGSTDSFLAESLSQLKRITPKLDLDEDVNFILKMCDVHFDDFVKKGHPVVMESYYFKFLVDRKNRLFEIQYNYFDYIAFLNGGDCYLSRTVTYFPPKLVYFFMLLNIFFYFLILNFKFLATGVQAVFEKLIKSEDDKLFFTKLDLNLTRFKYLIKF